MLSSPINETKLQGLGVHSREYTIKLISQGSFGIVYEVVGGFNTEDAEPGITKSDELIPAIVKVVMRNSEKDDEEVENLKQASNSLMEMIYVGLL